jgi:hypothetical protein
MRRHSRAFRETAVAAVQRRSNLKPPFAKHPRGRSDVYICHVYIYIYIQVYTIYIYIHIYIYIERERETEMYIHTFM